MARSLRENVTSGSWSCCTANAAIRRLCQPAFSHTCVIALNSKVCKQLVEFVRSPHETVSKVECLQRRCSIPWKTLERSIHRRYRKIEALHRPYFPAKLLTQASFFLLADLQVVCNLPGHALISISTFHHFSHLFPFCHGIQREIDIHREDCRLGRGLVLTSSLSYADTRHIFNTCPAARSGNNG